MTVYKNHSQLGDLTKTTEELDKQRLHMTTLDLYSCPPPIGHVYSVMMESIGDLENPANFLGTLKEFMRRDPFISQPYPRSLLERLNSGTIQAFSHYLSEQGLRREKTYHDLIKEAMGYDCEWLRDHFRACSERFLRDREPIEDVGYVRL